MTLQECPEDGALFEASLDHAQQDRIVVEEVDVNFEFAGELNKHVAEALVRRPIRETIPQVLDKLSAARKYFVKI